MQDNYDVVVIGGGPAGCSAATLVAEAGNSVLLLERESVPRFHVGESLIPSDMSVFADLGLLDDFESLPRFKKTGVEFALGDDSAGSKLCRSSLACTPSSRTRTSLNFG